MWSYFNNLRWKIIRANHFLKFIHYVTMIPWFWKFMVQERCKSKIEFGYLMLDLAMQKYIDIGI